MLYCKAPAAPRSRADTVDNRHMNRQFTRWGRMEKMSKQYTLLQRRYRCDTSRKLRRKVENQAMCSQGVVALPYPRVSSGAAYHGSWGNAMRVTCFVASSLADVAHHVSRDGTRHCICSYTDGYVDEASAVFVVPRSPQGWACSRVASSPQLR